MRQRGPRATFILITIISLLVGILLQACGADTTPVVTPTPAPVANESKIDTVLLSIILKYVTTEGTNDVKAKTAIDYARQLGLVDDKDQVSFELELDDPAAEKPITDKISAMGAKVTNSAKQDNVVKLRITVSVNLFLTYSSATTKDNFLADLAAFKGVNTINLIYPRKKNELVNLPQTRAALIQVGQAVKNEGVKIMQTDKWQAAGFTGKGVRVGIIDGGFKFYEELLGTYLPADFAPVDIDKDSGGDGVLDADVHGSAVSEIIHSNAPDAKLFAAAVDGSDDQISSAIDYLVKQNVSIISMSMGGHGTSGNGDSFIEKKMSQIRATNGILFVVSAGNEGDSHYTGFFDPAPDGFHQFVPGVTKMALGYPARSGAPLDTYVILNWEQWLNGGVNPKATDFDLFIETSTGATKISSTGDQRSRPPREYVPLKLSPGELVYIRVRLKPNTSTPTQPLRLHIFTHNLPLQFFTPTIAIGDPAAGKGVIAVGAVDWDKDKIAYYSSQGPLPNGTFKPEISAPAGVSSGAYQVEGETDFPGTSASCPQVSGLLAVFKSANPSLTADQLATVLFEHTVDKGLSGPDPTYGYGRASAGSSPSAADASPKNKLVPTPTPNTNPNIAYSTSSIYPTPVRSPIPTNNLKPSPAPTTVAATPAEPPPPPPSTLQPVSSVDFTDTFRSSSSGLPNSGSTSYQAGRYNIKAAAGQLTWAVYPINRITVEDFDSTLSVQGINSGAGVYGLVFWYTDAQNYYMLSLTGAGTVQISQFSSGSWKQVSPWTQAGGWSTTGTNTLRLLSTNGTIQVGINNRSVFPQSIKAAGSGAIGFAAGSYSGSIEANFTNFRLSTR